MASLSSNGVQMVMSWIFVICFLNLGYPSATNATDEVMTGEFFNCHRKGISCENGACNAAGTGCDCSNGYTLLQGYHCVPNAIKDATCTDTAKCGTNGECRVKDGADTCFCDQRYTGDTCQTPRLKVECPTGGVSVTVFPHGTFTGSIFAKQLFTKSECVMKAGEPSTFAITDTDSTNCGVTFYEKTDAAVQTFAAKAEVQVLYTAGMVLSSDQLLTATCIYPSTATLNSNPEAIRVQNEEDDTSDDDGEGGASHIGAGGKWRTCLVLTLAALMAFRRFL